MTDSGFVEFVTGKRRSKAASFLWLLVAISILSSILAAAVHVDMPFPLVAIIVFVCLFSHLLPIYIARKRNHQNTLAITVVNVLLGWTVIGYVVALIWACTAVNQGIGSVYVPPAKDLRAAPRQISRSSTVVRENPFLSGMNAYLFYPLVAIVTLFSAVVGLLLGGVLRQLLAIEAGGSLITLAMTITFGAFALMIMLQTRKKHEQSKIEKIVDQPPLKEAAASHRTDDYVVYENGQVDLKMPSGNWRRFDSIDEAIKGNQAAKASGDQSNPASAGVSRTSVFVKTNGPRALLAILIVVCASLYLTNSKRDDEARSAGFTDHFDREAAEKAGIADAAIWTKRRSEEKSKAEEKLSLPPKTDVSRTSSPEPVQTVIPTLKRDLRGIVLGMKKKDAPKVDADISYSTTDNIPDKRIYQVQYRFETKVSAEEVLKQVSEDFGVSFVKDPYFHYYDIYIGRRSDGLQIKLWNLKGDDEFELTIRDGDLADADENIAK